MHAAFILQLGKNPFTFDMGDKLFHTAQLCGLMFNNIKTPAFGLNIALIHADQIGGKKRSFITACSRTNFQNRRTRICLIFRQKRQLQIMLGLGQCRAEHGQLFCRQLAHIWIIHHHFRIRYIAQQSLIGPHFFDHWP